MVLEERQMITRDLIVIIAIIITILLGAALRIKKVPNAKWKFIYVIPIIFCIIHFAVSNRNIFMYPVYFAAVLELVLLLLCKKKVIAVILSVLSIAFAVSLPILTLLTKANCYASLGYADAFTAFHNDMKEHYALQDWKETDFDTKYAEYIGLFEEAEKSHDKTAYVSAMLSYLASYQDGHVQLGDMYEVFGLGSTRNIQNIYAQIYKNYYGMTLLQLDSGEYVAANVEKGSCAETAGIKNGMVVTKWNGLGIKEQLSKMENLIPVNCSRFADTENMERFKPFLLSCMGDEKLELEFLDEEGNTKEVTLTSMGNGYKYLYQTIGLFLQKEALEEDELSYCTLENDIGYLQINGMGNDFEAIRSQIEDYIDRMKEEQISSLIIDVRNNSGGEDEAGVILAEQFSSEDMFYLKETTYDVTSGKYIERRTLKMNAKAAIDIPIYLLVNSNCISAGEGFVYNMAKLDNVTIVGIQGTNGSFGTVDGIVVMPEGMLGAYPSIACLDENGEIMIDSKYHGIGGIKPEMVIPVNQEAASAIFSKDYDYELEYLCSKIVGK